MTEPSTSNYPLFKHMAEAHGLTLIEDELYQIQRIAAALAQSRIADLECELAEARKPLRWTSEAPKVAGLWAWITQDKRFRLSHLSAATLKNIEWNEGTIFYGPIPEPMP